MKLISMTDFVLERKNKSISEMTILETFKEGAKITNEIFNYATFLKQPLTLGMFVPCDSKGFILNNTPCEVKDFKCIDCDCEYNFNKAKDRVLFGGFELVQKYSYGFKLIMRIEDFSATIDFMHEDNIEELLTLSVDFDFELTESAIKQLGL